MNLDINLTQQTPPDNLPDQPQNQMFSPFFQITRTDVDYGTSDTFCRSDDDIVIFCHLECVEGFWFPFGEWFVEDTFIDGFRDGVVDQLAQDETIYTGLGRAGSWKTAPFTATFVEQLHSICRDRQNMIQIRIASQNLSTQLDSETEANDQHR